MSAEAGLLTVAEICRLALPLNAQVLAAAHALERPVRWAVTVSADAPLPYLEGDELLLVAPAELSCTPSEFISACCRANVAGLVMLEPVDPLLIALAEAERLPLIALPRGSRLRDVERLIVGLLIDRQGHFERRSAQIYEQLIEIATENVGLEGIVQALGNFLHKGIVLQDKHLRVQACVATPELASDWDSVLTLLKDRSKLPQALSDRHRLPRHTSISYSQTLRNDGLSRLVTPIVAQGIGRGYLSAVTRSAPFTELDRLVLQHGATICALEMARQKMISEAEKRLRGDFLHNLLSGTFTEAEALAEGDRFRHDMSAPHVAIVIAWQGEKHPSIRRLETLVNTVIQNRNAQALVYMREEEIRLFLAADSRDLVTYARAFAQSVIEAAANEYRQARLAIGIGSVVERPADWISSYRDAAHAANIARRLRAEQPLYAADLGIYTLLARPDLRNDLLALRDKMIGRLLSHDERQRTDLLQTLEAFLESNGNATQTADKLSVHRNTLLYRMSRIQDILKLDLDQTDVRLAVHLALKIHRLLGDES
ncbi:MAG: helix-turn-helix domain-containing protein [Anaerolineae bacterium]|nr:helix-turn-helix domain-containing protein [Anaerolineae bacterium]MDW8297777.1 helix-turn-helix domain-containing protein [Anaerolineae bacterium]